MPAIRALTGIDDDRLALAAMEGWRRPESRVVELGASDLAGRRNSRAPHLPAGMNPDGSVWTISGGLPGLGKRHG